MQKLEVRNPTDPTDRAYRTMAEAEGIKHGGTVKGFIGLMVAMVAILVVVGGCEMAQAAAVSPAKINPQKNTVVYFGEHTFANEHYTDTLVWASDRNFNDTANYNCAVFVSGKTTTGILKGLVLNDSSIIVASSVVTDSTLVYYYQVMLQAK